MLEKKIERKIALLSEIYFYNTTPRFNS